MQRIERGGGKIGNLRLGDILWERRVAVNQVILVLERQTEVQGVRTKTIHLIGRSAAGIGSHRRCGNEQISGLVLIDEIRVTSVKVLYLSAHNANASRSKFCHDCGGVSRGSRRYAKRKSLQGVTRKDGYILSELAPDCGESPSRIVIIHRRKVIMDKRVAMQQLYRARREDGIVRTAADRNRRRKA